MTTRTVLAVDLGAESGRVMAAQFDGRTLALDELHRFPNTTTTVRGTLYWNLYRLWDDVQVGLERGLQRKPASLGVDAWGVDFGLLDAHGELLGAPVHYRDERTKGMMDLVFSRLPKMSVFEQTGVQFMPINTLYQLASLAARGSPQLEIAATFLTVPDLLNYWLTGEKVCEFSNATTTQLYNSRTHAWAGELMRAVEIPLHIFPEVVQPGTRVGSFRGTEVVAPACHDTGSAVAAVPASTRHFAYISSGTWSLVGLEMDAPLLSAAALAANVTNEGGVDGTYRLLKNVTGLWIVQQCRRAWQREGQPYSYADLVRLAQAEPPLRAFIPVDDPRLLLPGDYPALIRGLCRENRQRAPETPGAVVRCVLESLALHYRSVLDTLRALTGRTVEVVHIVGGGGRNELLNQMTANALGLPVVAGPAEATVLGNAAVQLMSLREISSLGEARRIIAASQPLMVYEPQDQEAWQNACGRYQALHEAAPR